MPETDGLESTVEGWIGKALHDLSQPLTAIECGLYVGTMSPDGVSAPTAEELLRTINEALEQAGRAITQVRAMQDRLNECKVMEVRAR